MAHEKNHDYHILDPSIWPFLGALGGFTMLFGSVLFFQAGFLVESVSVAEIKNTNTQLRGLPTSLECDPR